MGVRKGEREPGGKGTQKTGSAPGASEIDALFQLPLSEFTAARNALAARVKKAGRADEADAIKALVKPSISAWVVNQLYWRHRAEFDRLVATGERFRQAQAAQLDGKAVDLRGPLEARREALAELSRRGADVLRKAGSTPAPDTMRRVTTTLEALSTYGSIPDGPRAGRLADDVDPPGFETLAALVPNLSAGGGAGPSRVLPFQQHASQRPPKRKGSQKEDPARQEEERKAALAAARATVTQAERALRDARKTAETAEAALKRAAARAKEAERAAGELEARLEKATAEAKEARQDARRVAAQAEEAAQEVEDSERALAAARQRLQELQ